jgi:GNAT superfamily N-acetyltransferase
MWVDPAHRRAGTGRRLTDAVIEWARSERMKRLELWVTELNTPAVRLDERLGFAPTGGRAPLPSNPTLVVVEMAREL